MTIILEQNPVLFYFILFLTFSVIGSFLNVVIYRLPEGKSLSFPPSTCPKCQNRLKPYHNIPIISWLFLKGKCGFCNESISIQYPIIEFVVGIIGLSVFYINGLSIESLLLSLIFSTMIAMSIIDYRTHEIQDSLNITIMIMALMLWIPNINNAILLIQNFLIGAGAIALLRFFVTSYVGEEAMGEGDIPVVATMSAILGLYATDAVFYSALIALIAHSFFKKEIPFIPFLTIGLMIVWYSKYSILQMKFF